MSNIYNAFATWEQYIIYLRKSRQDDPRETVEEVLAKHETMLQEYAVREFGHKIPEENIYREVVSGESIDARVEIKKVLSRIEDPNIKGVIVIEPSRLSRGDLLDCGRLINDLRYTKTQVVTPYMTYNLENKMERKFFQDELLRGNDYLEYTKEILWRGRVAAAKRGCYISGGPAPYGFKKIKDGKDWILEIKPDEAEIVRQVFQWFAKDGMSTQEIADRLTDLCVPHPNGAWKRDFIYRLLRNEHYRGKIVYNQRKKTTVVEDGERITRRIYSEPEDVIIAEGRHDAIIDEDIWEAAKIRGGYALPKAKKEVVFRNPLATMIFCGKCGTPMQFRLVQKGNDRYECRGHIPRCFRSATEIEVETTLVHALENVELPALKLKAQNDEGNAHKIQQKVLANLQKQLADFEAQEEKQFDLLESGTYSKEIFEQRHGALVSKMKTCKEEILKAKQSMPKEINYAERVATLENAIALMKDPDATAKQKNKMLKTIIDRVEYHGTPYNGDRKTLKSTERPFTLKVFLKL